MSAKLGVVRVNALKLLDALQRAAWRQGMVKPELLRHRIDETGAHHFTLVLPGEDVEYTPPINTAGPGVGATVGADPPDGKK